MAGTRALVGPRLKWIDGTHLYPMEKPAETADQVVALLREMALTHVDAT
jgi:hypothetical protein